jgi:hypothetical protein
MPVAAASDDGLAQNVAGDYRILETGAPIHVDASANAISFGGPKLLYAGSRTYRTAGNSRVASIQMRDGRVDEIVVRRSGNIPLRLLPVATWKPSLRELRWFEGMYYSDELDARYIVRATSRGLELDGPNSAHFSLRAAYRNVFIDDDTGWTVLFSAPNGLGKRTMSFTATRVRNVTFVSADAAVR